MKAGDLVRVVSPIAKTAPVHDRIGKLRELHHGDLVVFLGRDEGLSVWWGETIFSVLSPIGKVAIDNRWLAHVQDVGARR